MSKTLCRNELPKFFSDMTFGIQSGKAANAIYKRVFGTHTKDFVTLPDSTDANIITGQFVYQ